MLRRRWRKGRRLMATRHRLRFDSLWAGGWHLIFAEVEVGKDKPASVSTEASLGSGPAWRRGKSKLSPSITSDKIKIHQSVITSTKVMFMLAFLSFSLSAHFIFIFRRQVWLFFPLSLTLQHCWDTNLNENHLPSVSHDALATGLVKPRSRYCFKVYATIYHSTITNTSRNRQPPPTCGCDDAYPAELNGSDIFSTVMDIEDVWTINIFLHVWFQCKW